MKYRLLFALALAVLPALPAFAQKANRNISVSGSAEIKVAPDEILLNVGVESRHPKLDQAKRLNDESVAAALAFLRRSGVPDKDVQTDFISIEPDYERDNSNRTALERSTRVPLLYIVRKSIGIKVTRVADFDALLTGLLENGVQYIHGIEFRTSQLRKHRDAARALAIRAAKEKADALTSELGVRRGPAQSISESYSGGWWRSAAGWGNSGGQQLMQNVMQNGGGSSDGGEDGATSAVGQISVNASVNVTFEIE
ncbi:MULTISPECIES: SIMPL domain-containing protein [unclassified Lysobacter]|uniref:SIMPL domain-containing protein n=1 Tax=unclassified Lysobacter TaxID=2635362 RepID=UPI001BEA05E0|nr:MULTISPECIES: SIMPL domain-containing protein [unclassified Lysobacter]MBT2750183.1 SIMPL domain-containing protein [Lysobacter sp. ISL-50]MBT2775246.1 SIMPL domain-containing protein [Lysobacter sp. ISL-54]MBT2782619.1 SIMPL domain-containing protein [Lysobacter sp. ISL-52]